MSVWFGIHIWCGFGCNGGLFPELRLGVIRVGCCKGAVGERVRKATARIAEAAAAALRRVP